MATWPHRVSAFRVLMRSQQVHRQLAISLYPSTPLSQRLFIPSHSVHFSINPSLRPHHSLCTVLHQFIFPLILYDESLYFSGPSLPHKSNPLRCHPLPSPLHFELEIPMKRNDAMKSNNVHKLVNR